MTRTLTLSLAAAALAAALPFSAASAATRHDQTSSAEERAETAATTPVATVSPSGFDAYLAANGQAALQHEMAIGESRHGHGRA